MPFLAIHHVTTYRFHQPVAFGEHRLMMRPREGHDQRLLDTRLEIDPPPVELRWLHDVFGNSVAIARFDARADRLCVDSHARVEQIPTERGDVEVEAYARLYPFTYASEDMPDLLRSIERDHRDARRVVDDWAHRFVRADGPTETAAMLAEMTRAIKQEFTYVRRPEPGTQTPVETLESQGGSCRDFAVLMIEAARALGFAARFVSGYVYSPSSDEDRVGGGNTHAWVRIFLPGSGWVEFDPTNGIVGSRGLVRVAVARDPLQAVPLSGTWRGAPGSYIDMDVTVDVAMDSGIDDAEVAPDQPRRARC
jgi:transglutaminase-like putative cysteine protease